MNSSTVLTLRGGCNEFNHNYNLNDRHGNPLNFDVTSPGWPAGERLLYQHGVNGADGAAAVRQRQEVGKGWRRRRLVSLRQRPAADDRAGPGFPGAGRDITDRITANVSDNLYLNKNAFATTPVNRFADTPRILPGTTRRGGTTSISASARVSEPAGGDGEFAGRQQHVRPDQQSGEQHADGAVHGRIPILRIPKKAGRRKGRKERPTVGRREGKAEGWEGKVAIPPVLPAFLAFRFLRSGLPAFRFRRSAFPPCYDLAHEKHPRDRSLARLVRRAASG